MIFRLALALAVYLVAVPIGYGAFNLGWWMAERAIAHAQEAGH